MSFSDKAYPFSLRHIPQPPKELFFIGPLEEALEKPCVAIVGSRKVTPYGKYVTELFARELAKAGVVIVSGLALGVDSIAHKAALDAGGITIAVLPSGLDHIYPRMHANLANDIVQHNGVLVTEYPTGQGSPAKYQFIARNRIIASLSRAVIITEAAEKSGSLHTANFALEQGIEVLAVPGNITSTNSAGTNNLLRQGAQPITSSKDVFEILDINPVQLSVHKKTPEAHASILTLLANNPLTTDELHTASGIAFATLTAQLTELELSGTITATAAGTWIVTGS